MTPRKKDRQYEQRQVGKTQQWSFPLLPDWQTVVIQLNKSLYSYLNLAASLNHCSFPHFSHAVLFISILQQRNKSHIISISPVIPCNNPFSNWTKLSQHRSDAAQLERWQKSFETLEKLSHRHRAADTKQRATYILLSVDLSWRDLQTFNISHFT